MNNFNFLSIALLVTFLMSTFGIYFLIILEIFRRDGNFRRIKGIVLSLLFAVLIVTGPMLMLQIGDYAPENISVPYLILDISLWPALIVIYIVIMLILIVLVAVKSAGEENEIPVENMARLHEKSQDDKLIERANENLISNYVGNK